jgi:hypothetical protein
MYQKLQKMRENYKNDTKTNINVSEMLKTSEKQAEK